MHVGIITYQTGHLKTWQMTRKVLTKGFRVTLYAFPFQLRPPKADVAPRYQDRPGQLIDLDIARFCGERGIGYVEVGGWSETFAKALGKPGAADTPEVFLHCIAKIVPASFIEGRIILNCHPGLLPHNRGVDAFKWSIVNRWPVGITLHAIDAEIDRGTILHRMRVPVFPADTLDDVWRRAYDFEIDLLGNFEHHIGRLGKNWLVGDDHPCSHSLISLEQDQQLPEIFAEHRVTLSHLSTDPNTQFHESDLLTSPA